MNLSKRFYKGLLRLSVLLLIAFLMTGCLPDYYYGQAHTIPTPVLNSPEPGSTTYISGALDIGDGSNDGENNIAGKLNIQHGYTGQFFSIGAHGEIYQGSYKIEEIENLRGKSLSYYGFSPQINASLFFPFKKNRIGIYGLSGPVYEYGDYPDWLEEADDDGTINLISGFGDFDPDIQGNNDYINSVGLLYERVISPNDIFSFKAGLGTATFMHFITQYRKGRNVYKLGIGSSLSLSYGIAL